MIELSGTSCTLSFFKFFDKVIKLIMTYEKTYDKMKLLSLLRTKRHVIGKQSMKV